MTSSKEIRFTRAFFTASTLLPALLLLTRAPESLFCLAAGLFLLLLAAAGWIASEKFTKGGKSPGFLLTLGVFCLTLILPEALLRSVDFRYESRLEFGFPRPEIMYLYQPDPDLFWVFHEGPGINKEGFRSGPLNQPKTPETFRILLLGDSCIFKYFPEMLKARLEKLTDRKIEIVNLAVPGYSSYQGRMLAEKFGYAAEPDLVIISFGWNDHWLAYDARDSGKKAKIEHARVITSMLHHSRLLQGILWSLDRFKAPLPETRVLPEEYRENLSAMRQVFKHSSAPVVFFTAASAHESLGVEDAIIQKHFGNDKGSIISLHKTYNEIVRQTARDQDGILFDLENSLKGRPDLNTVFKKDGIHFSEEGFEVLVSQTIDFLTAQQLVPQKEQRIEAR